MRTHLLLAMLPLLAACSGGAGQVYPLAADDALSRLHNLDDAGFIANQRCGLPITMAAETLDAATIKWSISADGVPGAAFTVHVEPTDKGQSRVIIALPKDPAGGEIYDGNKHPDQPLVQQPLRPALEELVAAAFEGRKFDPARIKAPVNDDVCVLQRQTSGNDKPRFGPRGPGPAAPAAGGTVDAWGSPSQAGPSSFGNPAVAALPAPPNAAPAGQAGAPPPPPPPPPAGPGGRQPLIN